MQECPGCHNKIPTNVVTCPHCRYWLRSVLEEASSREEEASSSEEQSYTEGVERLETSKPDRGWWNEMHHKPTTVQVFGILRSAFIVWRHLIAVLAMLAVFAQLSSIPLLLLFAKANIEPFDFEHYTPALVAALLLALIVGAPLILGSWAAALMAIDAVFERRQISTSAFTLFKDSFHYFGRLLVSSVFVAVAMVVASSPAIVASYWLKNEGSQAVGTVLSLLGFVSLFFVLVKLAVVAPAVVLGGATPTSALFRSASLVRGRFMTVLGVLMSYWLCAMVVQSFAAMFMFNPVLGEIAGTAANIAFVIPFSWAVYYCIYRFLKETSPKTAVER